MNAQRKKNHIQFVVLPLLLHSELTSSAKLCLFFYASVSVCFDCNFMIVLAGFFVPLSHQTPLFACGY